MNVLKMISFLVVLTFAAGCGKKEAVESEKQPEEKPGQERTDTVHLSDESLKLVTIDTITVAQGALNLSLRAPGRISFNLNHTAKVSSTFEGRIVKMNYDVGAEVHEGDTMALIDSPDFLNQALELKAPLSGEVVERQGTPGELVDKGKELYTVSDLAKVWVVANVNADDIAAVHVGQPATLQTMAYPDETFTGKVALVSPEVQEKSRSVEIRIEADNQDAKLKPGLFANVEIATSTLDNVIVIPDEAIQRMDDQEIAFVAADAHTFIKRVIKTGRAQNGSAEILAGLKDGEHIVTKGSFLLKSELLKSQLGE